MTRQEKLDKALALYAEARRIHPTDPARAEELRRMADVLFEELEAALEPQKG